MMTLINQQLEKRWNSSTKDTLRSRTETNSCRMRPILAARVIPVCSVLLTLVCATREASANGIGLEVLDHEYSQTRSASGDASAGAYAGDFYLGIEADAGLEGGASINADSRWEFRPTKGPLTIDFDVVYHYNYYSYEQGITATLHDLTTGALLLELNGSDFEHYDSAGLGPFPMNLDRTHVYEFLLSGFAIASDFKEVDLRVDTRFSTVPESGPSLGLVAVAMAGLILPRWRRQ